MKPGNPTRAICYSRVSTAEQGDEGHSLDAQEATLRDYCAGRSWEPVVIREVATGTSLRKRPQFRQAIEMLDSGQAQVIVVTKLDRLSRSVIDSLTTLERARRNGWQVVILDLQVDTTTPMGQVFFTISAAFAQLYRDQISENTKAGLKHAKANGTKSGRPIGRTREVPDEIIDRIRDLRGEGHSYREIAAMLDAEGLHGPRGGAWHHWSVREALRRADAAARAAGA